MDTNIRRNYIDKTFILTICGMVSVAFGVIFLYFVTISKSGDMLYCLNSKRLFLYIALLSVCLSFFLLSAIFIRRYNRLQSIAKPLAFNMSSFLLLIIGSASVLFNFKLLYFEKEYFYGEVQVFPGRRGAIELFPIWFSGAIVTACLIFSLFIILNERHKNDRSIALYSIYIILALLNGLAYGVPNTFVSDIYHCNAVTTSIYNVYYNIPYTTLNASVYGHYALFFKIPMMIFGESPLVIAAIMGILGVITSLLIFASMHMLLKSNFIKVLGAIAAMFLPNIIQFKNYWQTMPIRWVFPSIIIFMCTLLAKKRIKISSKIIIIGSALSSVAVLWHTETGIFCGVGFAAFCVLTEVQINKISIINFIKLIIMHFIILVCEVLIAILIMNFYNLIVGGNFDINVFFFPMNSKGFMDSLLTPLTFTNRSYIYIFVIYMCCLFWSLTQTNIFKNENGNSMAPAVAITSILGLAMLSYYFNRPACGVAFCYVQTIICSAILADKMASAFKSFIRTKKCSIYDCLKIGVGGFTLSGLIVFTIFSSFTSTMFLKRFDKGYYNIDQLVLWANEVREVVPKDTYALGQGTAEIYGVLGWDTQYHLRDFPSIPFDHDNASELLDKVKMDLSQRKAAFFYKGAYRWVPDNYKLIKQFNFGGNIYGYFCKIGG